MKDCIMPTDKWVFDKDVADCFEDMLRRSIPDYPVMRELVFRLGQKAMGNMANPTIVDIGCSNGLAVERFVQAYKGAHFIMWDNSQAMIDEARKRYPDERKFDIACADIVEAYPICMADLCMMVLTLQFTPIEERQRILQKAYTRMNHNGAIILVEKVIGDNASAEETLTDVYYDLKAEHGYTAEQIQTKRKSLRNVMTPLKADWDEELLRKAGFVSVTRFWQCLNFCGWIAYKR